MPPFRESREVGISAAVYCTDLSRLALILSLSKGEGEPAGKPAPWFDKLTMRLRWAGGVWKAPGFGSALN
jgi:hypothetical protein